MESLRIAVIISDITEDRQKSIVTSLERTCAIRDYCLCFFVYSQNGLEEKQCEGSRRILSVFDPANFDALIVACHLATVPEEVLKAVFFAREKKLPVVSLMTQVSDTCYIGFDTFATTKEIVSHLIEVHKLTRINCITGNISHDNGRERLRGYRAALDEHGLPYDERRVFIGGTSTAEMPDVFNNFNSASILPAQAIIAPSDSTAWSIVSTAETFGMTSPDRLKVVGFGDTNLTRTCIPTLATVSIPDVTMCDMAVDSIEAMLRKESVPESRTLAGSFVPGGTCGCVRDNAVDAKNICVDLSGSVSKLFVETIENNTIRQAVSSSDSLTELTSCLEGVLSRLSCQEAYFSLQRRLLPSRDPDSEERGIVERADHSFQTGSYDKMLHVFAGVSDNRPYHPDDYLASQILPTGMEEMKPGNFYFCLPVHYLDRTFGTFVISNCNYPLEPNCHDLLLSIGSSLANMSARYDLNVTLSRFRRLAMTDSLTGLLNRYGFLSNAVPVFDSTVAEKKTVGILYFDLDHLKYINDIFGHEEGDKCIILLAWCLKQAAHEGDILARLGGDEFVLFATDVDTGSLESRVVELEKIMKENTHKVLDHPFTSSHGSYLYNPSYREKSFNECLNEADGEMYRNKASKHYKRDSLD